MPVVNITLDRFRKMLGAERKLIMERIPYIGLDIEGSDSKTVRVEKIFRPSGTKASPNLTI